MTRTPASADAFARYEAVRPRLPCVGFGGTPVHLPSLAEVAELYDGFLLDAFGVLNVGDTAIPGAVARMADLRKRGKRLCVLSNAASYTRAGALAKYRGLGFDFTADEIVTSRDVAALRLDSILPGGTWAAISASGDDYHDIPADLVDAIEMPGALDSADGILFLSSQRWSAAWQSRLIESLAHNPRPLVVANPDLVAPQSDGFSIEPGMFAHALLDVISPPMHWFGKPYGACFADGLARLGLPAHRVAMVGDTLHTDILGGRAAAMGTVLITDHGLFAGHDVAPFVAQSGIRPDVICATT